MPFLSKMISFWNNLFRRHRVERDLNDELHAYIDEMAERKIQSGLAPEAAREAALLELGGIERIKDLVRQQRVGFRDLRREDVTIVVAIIAFLAGAGAAVAAMRWSTPLPVEHTAATAPVQESTLRKPWAKLEGRIVDKTTGEPIPYVEVGLEPAPTSRRYTYTDGEGRFSFLDPPAEGYRLKAGEQQWAIGGFQMQPARFVNPQTPPDEFHIFLPSDVVVTGKNGQPIEGERRVFPERVVEYANGKTAVSPSLEDRIFHYETSVIELKASKVIAGKTVNFFPYTNRKVH